MKCGVYKIQDIETGKFYIGSAINIARRTKIHLSKLRHNKHENLKLQRCFNKRPHAFQITVIQETPPNSRLLVEQHILNDYIQNPLCLNICSNALAPMDGRTHSNATKERMKALRRGRTLSEETKKRISLAKTGKKRAPFSKEWKLKMSLARQARPGPTTGLHIWKNRVHPMLGKKHSKETCKHLSEMRQGRNHWNWKGGNSYNFKQKLNE